MNGSIQNLKRTKWYPWKK